MPKYTREKFDSELRKMLQEARNKEQQFCSIAVKGLHDQVVGKSQTSQMRMACEVMLKLWKEQGSHKDRIINSPPSNRASRLTIKFDTKKDMEVLSSGTELEGIDKSIERLGEKGYIPKAIINDPQNAKEYYERGNKRHENGDYDGAMADYTEALRLNPNYSLAWYKLGNAWFAKGDIDESIICYTEAIQLEPNSAIALYKRGIMLIKKGEFNKAITDFDVVLLLDPKNQDAIDNRDVALCLKFRREQTENQRFSSPAQFSEEAITQKKLENYINELIKQSMKKGYIPKELINKLNSYSTVEAIKMLVNSKKIQSEFRKFQEIGLLHLSVETAVLKFPEKFTFEEQESARWRLEQLGYDFGLQEDIETTHPVSDSSDDITNENEGGEFNEEDIPLSPYEQQGEPVLVLSSPNEREKSCEEYIEIMARESLDIFSKIADAAQSEFDGTPTGSRFSPLAVPNAKAMENLRRGRQENFEGYRKLVREPANTRVIAEGEDGGKTIYYICRVAPPRIKCSDNIRLASYHAEMGRLAALPVDGSREVKGVFLEVKEKAEFQPLKDAEGWDSKPTTLQNKECNRVEIVSLRAFLIDTGKKEYKHIRGGKRRIVRDKMELPDQFILDQYQDELFRLPLNSRILLLGAPGTGKTTTLIRRLSQKLDVEHLSDDEKRIAGINNLVAESNHSESWIMFTPTEILKLYVKGAFNREGIPALDERISTWDEFRIDLARNWFGVLRSSSGSGSYVMKNSFLTLKAGAKTNLIEWFKDFDRWQKTIFLEEMRRHAKKILSEESSSEISMLGKNILTILGTDDAELQPSMFMSLLKVTEQVQALVKNIKESSDREIKRALNIQTNKDDDFLDNFASFIEGLPEEMSNSEEQDTGIDDEEEEEEQSPSRVGRDGAETHFMQVVRSQARARARNRNVSKSSRTGRLIEWLGDRTLPDEELKQIGKDLVLQSVLRQFTNPVPRYINRIPIRYRHFRKERQAEDLWYCTEGFSSSDIHPLEVDIILLAMILEANGLITGVPELNNPDNPAYKTLKKMQDLYRTQVLVDEVSDFSPIQLSCMMGIARPGVRSFFACGDLHQRITNWGTDSIEQIRWAIPDINVREVHIPYRQSHQLHNFAEQIIRMSGGNIPDAVLPYENNEGVSPIMATQMSKVSDIADWLSQHIQEIKRFVGDLPSIAVIVNNEEEVQSMADALKKALADKNIRVLPCLNGQFHESDNAVRVFSMEYIKGLEFESVFFVGVDKLAENQPDLFDKYLYVGATRAATYFGITCEQDLPQMMESLRGLFTHDWTHNKKQEYQTTDNQEEKNTDNNLLNSEFWQEATIEDVVNNIEGGANIEEVRENDGLSPLHLAVRHSEITKVVAVLLDAGVDMEARDEKGRTPLHFAIWFSKPTEMVSLLLDRGADIEAHDESGWTPLHWATIKSGTLEVVTLLLNRGANGSVKNDAGKTPFDHAKNNLCLVGSNAYKRLQDINSEPIQNSSKLAETSSVNSRDGIKIRTMILTVLFGGVVVWLLTKIFS